MLTIPVEVAATLAAPTCNGAVPKVVPMLPLPVVRFTVVPLIVPVPELVIVPVPLGMMLVVLLARVDATVPVTAMLPLDTPSELLSTIEVVPAAERVPAKFMAPVPRNPSVPPIVPEPVTLTPLLTSVIVAKPPAPFTCTFAAFKRSDAVLVPM